MTITVGYDLPFRAHAFTTPDDVLRVRVRCKPGTRLEGFLQVQTHVAIFLDAALFGMGAGASVPPRLDRRTIDDVLRVATTGTEVLLEAPVIVDPSYVTVLLHKLLGLSPLVPLEEVTVELPGLSPTREAIPIHRGDTSLLPEIHQPLPFALEDERSGHADGCTVEILYVQPPGAPELELLQDGLRVWIAQALQGGFISPPMAPGDAFVSADDDVTAHDDPHDDPHEDQVKWVMENFDLPHESLNGLLNFLAAYHQQVAALRDVLLE